MQSSPFGSSFIEGSTIHSDAYKQSGSQSVMANNITRVTINNHFHDVQQPRPRVISFADQETIRPMSVDWKTSKIPASISRLPNRDDCPQVPESAQDSTAPSYSFTSNATTTSSRPSSKFKMAAESRRTMRGKLKPRVDDGTILEYMQSDFFRSKNAIPLWEPSPPANARNAFKISNICVGDVGVFTEEGGFQVLFNIFLSHTDNQKLGFLKLPDTFQPYGSGQTVQFSEEVSRINEISYRDFKALDGDFLSDQDSEIQHPHPWRRNWKYIRGYHLIEKHANDRTTSSRSGSLLDLPNGVWRDRMFSTVIRELRGYFNLHADSWYNLYNPKGQLNIVTTTYKCSSWALAICKTKSPDYIFARLYQLPPDTDSDTLYGWNNHRDAGGKVGPLPKEGDDGLPLTNQCVAVEVCSIEKQNGVQKTMGAPFAGARNLSKAIINTFSNMSVKSSISGTSVKTLSRSRS